MIKVLAMNVEMSEVVVCPAETGGETLVTHGISTCIAIMLYGIYDDTPFILMDHWDGEVIGEKDIFVRYKLFHYIAQIQDTIIKDFDPDIHEDIPVHIEKVIVIGGEKKQLDKDGNLIVSGTESSVRLLKKNLVREIGEYCKFTNTATQSCNNYITSDNESITVQIDFSGTASFYFDEILVDTIPMIPQNAALRL